MSDVIMGTLKGKTFMPPNGRKAVIFILENLLDALKFKSGLKCSLISYCKIMFG